MFEKKITHKKFIIYFTLLVYIVYNLINIDKLTKWFYVGSDFSYLGFTAYIILGYALFVIVYTLLVHKFTTKLISILIIISSGLISYFILKYNIAFDTSMMLNVLNTNSTEVFPLFSISFVPYMILFILLPIFLILKVKIVYDNVLKHILKSIGLIFLMILISLSSIYLAFKQLHRAGNLSNKYILYSLVPDNFLAATIDVVKKKIILPYLGDIKDKEKIIKAHITKKDDLVVVLAIGEAIRQKNLSIYGYKKHNTTPLLSQIEGLYPLNGIATIGSTLYALKKILRKNNVKLTRITSDLNISTSCYVNFSIYDNCVVGETKVKPHKYEGSYDEDVIPYLEENLKNYNGGYRFILLHLGGGAHGPIYSNRYPKSFQKFKPFCQDPDMLNKCTKDERFNAYDNAMLYQDYVISNTIKTLNSSKVPYIFIFVSDHGESLGENGYVFHGMPPGMNLPYEQSHIALLVKSNLPIKIIDKKEYSQPDIFDTILDLFNISTKEFDKKGSFIKLK